MQRLVSVILPAYNVEDYIIEAVQSIINQTYENLEIIIIDDCSIDNTYAILQDLAKTDRRIRLYHNERNLKLVGTLNKALTMVTGDYIVRMDGDDVSRSDRIEKLYGFLQDNPTVSLVGSQVRIIDENANVTKSPDLPLTAKKIKKVARYVSPVLHIWMCKTELYQQVGDYRNILGAEDYDFILRLLSAGYQIANHPERLYDVRVRQGNTLSIIGIKQRISHEYCIELYNQRLKNCKNIDGFDYNELSRRYSQVSRSNNFFHEDFRYYQSNLIKIMNLNPLGVLGLIYILIKNRYIRLYLKERLFFKLILFFD